MTQAIEIVGDVERLALKPGDKLAVCLHKPVTCDQAAQIREIMAESFPDHEAVVIAGGRLIVIDEAAT